VSATVKGIGVRDRFANIVGGGRVDARVGSRRLGFGRSVPGFDLWQRCRHREKGVVSVVEVVLEEGGQYPWSGSVMGLPDKGVPPVQLLFLNAAVDINRLGGEVLPIPKVPPVPAAVLHRRKIYVQRAVGGTW
jgi:hypothetical protein